MFDANYMAKKEELDRSCAQREWTIEGRIGGKNVGKEKERQAKNEMIDDLMEKSKPKGRRREEWESSASSSSSSCYSDSEGRGERRERENETKKKEKEVKKMEKLL